MIYAVAGAKGGVGKSTVALNLGAELDAVVVDADLGMADLPTGSGPDLHDALAGRADPIEAVRSVGPVDILPCGRSLVGARAAETTALVRAIERVAGAYGDVVVDCPAGASADLGMALLAAGRCVLVTTPDTIALPDALRTWALARELDAGVAGVALNMAGSSPPTRAVADAVGAPAVAIPESAAVDAARAAGRPVMATARDDPAVDAFADLAATVRAPRSHRS